MTGEWLNVGVGSFPAPEPWINLDCHEGDGVHPDVVVDADDPCAAYDDVDRVYLGHVLEHVPWPDVPRFLRSIERALAPGGQVCVVGPDIYRVIRRWRDGLDPEGWDLVESILENPWDRAYGDLGYAVLEGREPMAEWQGARHWWNCYELRVVYALRTYTTLDEVEPQPIAPGALGDWPLVAYTQWQCAVTARKPYGE